MPVNQAILVILYRIGGMWHSSFTTEELQFFASLKTNVTILPNFSTSQEIFLLSGKVGPFKANQQTHVPLWLALHLKSSHKCKILPPFWFQESTLNIFAENEKASKNQLINLQNNEFFEISYIFLSRASDDIIKIQQVRALVQGLENMRRQKIRKLFEENRGAIKLKNLTTYEANRLRDPLSKLGIMVDRLKKSDLQKNRRQ